MKIHHNINLLWIVGHFVDVYAVVADAVDADAAGDEGCLFSSFKLCSFFIKDKFLQIKNRNDKYFFKG